jgi:SSS family transporter
MRHYPLLLALTLAPFTCVAQPGGSTGDHPVAIPAQQKMETKPARLPALPFTTNGGIAGKINDVIVVAGAPKDDAHKPLTVWQLSAPNPDKWTDTSIEVPRFAASAETGDALICAGGLVGEKPVNRVLRIEIKNGSAGVSELPALPKPVYGASAAVVKTTLYVFGGISSAQPGKLENALWILDLTASDSGWKKGPAMPAGPRAFSAVTSQYDVLCVFGGIVPSKDKPDKLVATREAWIYRPVPLEATSESGWQRLPDMPAPVAHAKAVAVGQAHVMVIGGVNEEQNSPSSAIAPPPANAGHPMLVHLITKAWCSFDHATGVTEPLALRNDASSIFLLGGADKAGAPSPDSQEITFPRSVRSLTWTDYVVIALYFVAMTWIGAAFSRKQNSSDEFSLGNRQVVWWAAGISMFATAASAISLMAVPALAFATNLVWLFPVIMLVPAYFVIAYVIFPLLRRMNLTSTYEYLDRRFNRTLRLIASGQCILFQMFGRAAVVLVLPSIAISAITGINVFASVLVMGALTTVYTALGGFEAVVWTAVFQGVLKFLTPLMVITVCIQNLPGGWHEFAATGIQFHKFDFALVTWDVTVPAVWILLTQTILVETVQKAGDQPIIQRIFCSPLKEVRRVTAMGSVCGITIAITTTLMGLCIFAYFHAHPDKFDPSAQNDQIVPLFLTQAMPAGFAGVVIAAIFASAMATVATSMNSVATLFTEDFYMRLRPNMTDSHRLRVLKIASYASGTVATATALVLAGQGVKSMMVTWNIISALLGGGIVGLYSLGMFTRRANGFGAVCGVLISLGITLYVKCFTHLHWMTLTPIAIISCMVSGYFLSFLSSHSKDLEGLTIYTPRIDPVSPEIGPVEEQPV